MKKDHLSFTLAISLGLVGVIGSYVGLRYVQYKNDEPFSVNSYESDANLDSGIEDLINSEEVSVEDNNKADLEVISEEPYICQKEYERNFN